MYSRNIVFILLVLFFNACAKEEEKVQKESIKVVKIFDLKKAITTQEVFKYPAQIEAFQDTLMAFEVPGKIVKFYFSEGDKVKKREVIAQLDDVIYKANFDSAKANYAQARKDFKRYEKLLKTKSVSQAVFDKYKQNLNVSKAALEVAEKNFKETKLEAEFDGLIAKKLVADFARVPVKQPIVRLQDTSSYKVKFFVPETDMLRTQGNLTPESISQFIDIYVTVGGNNKNKIKANLIDISTVAEKVTRTFEITLGMKKQKDMTILAGMTAEVQIYFKRSNNIKIAIPYGAIFTDDSKKSFVWIVDKTNKVHKQEIQTGNLSNEFIEVIDGLNKSDKIITSGVRFLQENDEVKQYKHLGE